ncbi:hypothetical protein K1T71_009673 [Dendrolimus kikuchii]|uniref:Uncharacterized protein n=1 Tax=Dendrolimus kikuchii TaxID=765133 RepID=A0ACC1CSR9_9NEOP|nr:hypothetical protein K1T71_009673 [Dendrolimus kikuchii]
MYIVILQILYGVLSSGLSTDNERVSYEGAQVWRTELRNGDDILLIKKLGDYKDLSIWSLKPRQVDFLITAENKLNVHRHLQARRLNHTVLIMDVQTRIDALAPGIDTWTENSLRLGHRLDWKSYPSSKVIGEYYNYVAENFPSICKVKNIGYTSENRSLKMISISDGNPKNKGILVVSGMHSREWIGITSALYILDNIITQFDLLSDYMKNKDWHIIPLLNPDGYEYTRLHDRLWRKNRHKSITRPRCRGVDINRNFETDWMIAGITATNECDHSFSGPFPFSELESQALRNAIADMKKPHAFFDLHSYGQLILYPWSAKKSPTPDYSKHLVTARGMAQAIYKTSSQLYKFGATYNLVYPATGTALDWAYSNGIHHAYAVETRDLGLNGFLTPPDQIEDAGKEIFAAVKHLAKVMEDRVSNRGSDEKSWF